MTTPLSDEREKEIRSRLAAVKAFGGHKTYEYAFDVGVLLDEIDRLRAENERLRHPPCTCDKCLGVEPQE